MSSPFFVSLSPEEASDRIFDEVVQGSFTGECIGRYTLDAPNGTCCLVQVFEKHYARAGNRLTLTVTADNLTGQTRVCAVAGGGGEGFFRFDWGASESFASIAEDALADFRL